MPLAPLYRRVPAAALAVIAVVALAIPAVRPASASEIETTVAARYPGILKLFANGEHDRALTALSGLETELAAGKSESQVEKIWKAKLHVLRDLIDDPEVLIPAIQLHHDAFVAYRGEGQIQLARHSRTMTAELVEVYVSRVESNPAKVVAARALASLGGYQQEDGSIGSAADLFVRALELDPSCNAALLGQASLYEKLGEYPKALPLLEKLLANEPKNLEARLRLAKNLARTGEPVRAFTLLHDIQKAAPDPKDASANAWVTLAYEEQARMLADEGSAKPAIEVLRQGLVRFPSSTEMLIAEGYLMERAGDSRGGQALANRAAQAARSTVEKNAPRLLYNRWPQDELTEARLRLRESSDSRLKRMLAALQGESAITTVGGNP